MKKPKKHVVMPFNTADNQNIPVAKTILSTYFKSSGANFIRTPGAGYGASCVVEFDTSMDLDDTNMIVEEIVPEIGGIEIPFDEDFLNPRACAMRGRNPDNPNLRKTGLPTLQRLEIGTDIANCLTTVGKDSMLIEPVVLRRPHGYLKGEICEVCPPITASYFQENNFIVEDADEGE